MKAIKYFACGLVMFALVNTTQSFGQAPTDMQHMEMKGKQDFHKKEGMIPNLTDEQKAKIKELRLTNMKEMLGFRNELGELKAKERTLTTADKADMKAIDENIDKISEVLGKIMKSRAQLKQQIRSLLTDEQRIYFDMHGMKSFSRHGMHKDWEEGDMQHSKAEMGKGCPMQQMQ